MKIIPLLLLLFPAIAMRAQTEANVRTLADFSLHGKIKSMTYHSCDAKTENGKVAPKAGYNENKVVLQFTPEGYLREQFYAVGTFVNYRWIYTYDTLTHRPLSAECRTPYSGDTYQHLFLYRYDDNGLLIARLRFMPGRKDTVRIDSFRYDPQGRLVSETDYYQRMPGTIVTYRYNETGKLAEERSTEVYAQLAFATKYEYDSAGFTSHLTRLNPEGKMVFECFYSNDRYGNPVTFTQKEQDGSVTISSYRYTYDAQGNWIEKITYRNNEPATLETRTIEYY